MVTRLMIGPQYKYYKSKWHEIIINNTCNVLYMQRNVNSTIVAVEKQWVLHILSVGFFSFSYAECNVQEPP